MAVGYLLEIDCRLRPEKRREFTLSSISLMQNRHHGHLKTTVYQDQVDPDHILWLEEWNDRQSVDDYVASERFEVLQGALRTLGSVTACRLVELGG